MEIPEIEPLIMIDPDIEGCIKQIRRILMNGYQIYTNMKKMVAHAQQHQ